MADVPHRASHLPRAADASAISGSTNHRSGSVSAFGVDRACARKDFAELRHAALAALAGVVVEIGFRSGHNLARYPPDVRRFLAVEPSWVARRLAAPRIHGAAVDVELVGLDGQRLPLADDCATEP